MFYFPVVFSGPYHGSFDRGTFRRGPGKLDCLKGFDPEIYIVGAREARFVSKGFDPTNYFREGGPGCSIYSQRVSPRKCFLGGREDRCSKGSTRKVIFLREGSPRSPGQPGSSWG